jgi:hypothetical protein
MWVAVVDLFVSARGWLVDERCDAGTADNQPLLFDVKTN